MLNLKKHPRIYFAGQIVGVEGYIESTAMGLSAANHILRDLKGLDPKILEAETMTGALIRYITESDPKHFQPMNANFGLLDPPKHKMPKSFRKAWLSERALKTLKKSLKASEKPSNFFNSEINSSPPANAA